MNDYAKGRLEDNNNPQREEYSIISNNCATFAIDVIKQDKSIKGKHPIIIDPRPNSIIEEYEDEFPSIIYDPNE